MSIESSINFKRIISHVRKQASRGRFPNGEELHRKFNIYKHGLNLKDIYGAAGVNLLRLSKKPARSQEIVKQLIIEYVRKETKRKHYPTHREIKHKLRVDLSSLFNGGIREVYKRAGIRYRLLPNQHLKYRKARAILKLAEKILPRLGFKIIEARDVMQHGVDILAEDGVQRIGIELKAYNRHEIIKKKDIEQSQRFLRNEKIDRVIILTSTSRIAKIAIPHGVSILAYPDIKELCGAVERKLLGFVRDSTVNVETEHSNMKRKQIIKYIKTHANCGKLVSARDILRDLNLCAYSYFENMDDAYKLANTAIPFCRLRYMRDKKLRNELRMYYIEKIKNHIKSQAKRSRYPTLSEIGQMLGVKQVWNYFRLSDLYREVGVPSYRERGERN